MLIFLSSEGNSLKTTLGVSALSGPRVGGPAFNCGQTNEYSCSSPPCPVRFWDRRLHLREYL